MVSRRARVELRTELGATRLQEVLVLLRTINLRGGGKDIVNLASIQPNVCVMVVPRWESQGYL
jgi:hypothetical protein